MWVYVDRAWRMPFRGRMHQSPRVRTGDRQRNRAFDVSLSRHPSKYCAFQYRNDEGFSVSKISRGSRKRQLGVSLVEQALTITFLCALLFGIVDCGRMLYAYHFVSSAARDASRWASVRSADSGLGTADSATVQALVRPPAGMGLDPAQVSTIISWAQPPNGSPRCTLNPKKTGCIVSVEVTYNFRFLLPLMPTRAVTMQSTSETVITQ